MEAGRIEVRIETGGTGETVERLRPRRTPVFAALRELLFAPVWFKTKRLDVADRARLDAVRTKAKDEL